MGRREDAGYEQMQRVEDPFVPDFEHEEPPNAPETDDGRQAAEIAEGKYGALGGGSTTL
jgi:hypothetical protein